eukprot:5059271-Prymnesium_polylepis.1
MPFPLAENRVRWTRAALVVRRGPWGSELAEPDAPGQPRGPTPFQAKFAADPLALPVRPVRRRVVRPERV